MFDVFNFQRDPSASEFLFLANALDFEFLGEAQAEGLQADFLEDAYVFCFAFIRRLVMTRQCAKYYPTLVGSIVANRMYDAAMQEDERMRNRVLLEESGQECVGYTGAQLLALYSAESDSSWIKGYA